MRNGAEGIDGESIDSLGAAHNHALRRKICCLTLLADDR